ncbi:MAG: hypothetical protein ACR2OX_07540 [Methyloligellaceae bacterium]
MSTEPTRAHHDMGGLLDKGPIDTDQHEIALWEKRIEAMMRLLAMRDEPIFTVDELRRGIEAIEPGTYATIGYYEKWITSLTSILVEKQILSPDELETRIADIKSREDRLP